MIVLMSIIIGIILIPLSFSLLDDWQADMERSKIKVHILADTETLYYIQDYDVFGL